MTYDSTKANTSTPRLRAILQFSIATGRADECDERPKVLRSCEYSIAEMEKPVSTAIQRYSL